MSSNREGKAGEQSIWDVTVRWAEFSPEDASAEGVAKLRSLGEQFIAAWNDPYFFLTQMERDSVRVMKQLGFRKADLLRIGFEFSPHVGNCLVKMPPRLRARLDNFRTYAKSRVDSDRELTGIMHFPDHCDLVKIASVPSAVRAIRRGRNKRQTISLSFYLGRIVETQGPFVEFGAAFEKRKARQREWARKGGSRKMPHSEALGAYLAEKPGVSNVAMWKLLCEVIENGPADADPVLLAVLTRYGITLDREKNGSIRFKAPGASDTVLSAASFYRQLRRFKTKRT